MWDKISQKAIVFANSHCLTDSSSALQFLFIIYMKEQGKQTACLEIQVVMEVCAFA